MTTPALSKCGTRGCAAPHPLPDERRESAAAYAGIERRRQDRGPAARVVERRAYSGWASMRGRFR